MIPKRYVVDEWRLSQDIHACQETSLSCEREQIPYNNQEKGLLCESKGLAVKFSVVQMLNENFCKVDLGARILWQLVIPESRRPLNLHKERVGAALASFLEH